MELSPNREAKVRSVFSWLWRLSILSLPWQTRWFTQLSPAVARPTVEIELLRISIYGSQIILLITVLCGLLLSGRKTQLSTKEKRQLGLIFVVLFGLSVFSWSLALTVQWWLQAILLGLFVFVLWRQMVSVKEFTRWLFISFVPGLIFGFWQIAEQSIPALKWLGIAAQNPSTSGVSVVGSQRWLRMYGVFPHPNIFAGWIGVIWLIKLATWLREQLNHTKKQAIIWWLTNIALGFALLLTFSRTAWLAIGIGMISIVAINWRDLSRWARQSVTDRLAQKLALITLCLVAIVLIWQWPQLKTRTQTIGYLEKISLDERQQSLQRGWGIAQWPYAWSVGIGPGAYVKALELSQQMDGSQGVIVPPHLVWLIMWSEFGAIGCLLLVWTAVIVARHVKRDTSFTQRWSVFPVFVAVFILSIGDHYLWTLWSGKTLVMVVFAWTMLSLDRPSASLASYEQRI